MSLRDIIGQSRPVRLLQRAVLNNHLLHAYLFHGPDGVGKKLTALTLAKVLNCDEETEDCCERCLSCRKIEDSNHPDVSVISPDGQFIKIDKIRQLQRSLSFRPYEGKRRVFILDGADRMRIETANALLKTLEEPPPDTLLVLLTTDKEVLLPTVVSRCQPLRFAPLPVDRMVEDLSRRLSIERTEARTMAALSQGSLGRALDMVEHEVWGKRPKIIQDLIDLPHHGVQRAFGVAQYLADLGEGLPLVFPLMVSWYRDLIVWKGEMDTRRLINQDFVEQVRETAVRMSQRSLIRRIEAISQMSKALDRNVNRLLAMESLMLELR